MLSAIQMSVYTIVDVITVWRCIDTGHFFSFTSPGYKNRPESGPLRFYSVGLSRARLHSAAMQRMRTAARVQQWRPFQLDSLRGSGFKASYAVQCIWQRHSRDGDTAEIFTAMVRMRPHSAITNPSQSIDRNVSLCSSIQDDLYGV